MVQKTGAVIDQWDLDDVKADLNWCGVTGSPTKVHRVQSIVLTKEGFTQPIVVTGGTLAWIDAGLPVTRGTAKVISLERQVRIVAGALVVTGVVLAQSVNHWFIGLSAFVGAGLVFAGITDFCGMGLLLARMPWNKR